jgi:hypothetical protein
MQQPLFLLCVVNDKYNGDYLAKEDFSLKQLP